MASKEHSTPSKALHKELTPSSLKKSPSMVISFILFSSISMDISTSPQGYFSAFKIFYIIFEFLYIHTDEVAYKADSRSN